MELEQTAMSQDAAMAGMAASPPAGPVMAREAPQVPEERRKQVKFWVDQVLDAKKHWAEKAFKKMLEDMDFAEGMQWEGKSAEDADKYVANLVLRHVNQRVASLYAKNPTAVVKRADRLDSLLWDGTAASLMQAEQSVMMAMQGGGMPDPTAMSVIEDAQNTMQHRKMIDRVGKTLQCLFHYFTREGNPPFKVQAKQLVRRVETCGVGYLKIGFQRAMERNPEIERQLADASEQLAHAEALAADIADEQIGDREEKTEELRLMIENLKSQVEIIVREGLVFDFPEATRIIPDKRTKHIRGFVGARWIAQEYVYDPDEIKERFQIDVGKVYTSYKESDAPSGDESTDKCLVFEIYDLRSGLEMVVCDGYPDFLKVGAPAVFMEQGHPFFALTFNNLESRRGPFPPSDVRLLRGMQIEHNRAREGLRVHRIANRPASVAPKGAFDEEDLQKFGSHDDHEIIEVKAPAGADIEKMIRPKPTVKIDPALYETAHLFEDMQRTTGSQEANFGGTSGATATESSIAEGSRVSSVSSNVDDLDDFLTAVARASGQVLLAEMSPQKVAEIVGPGASWPQASRKEIAQEIFLEIKAGSSGAPNRAAELANMERGMPFLVQIPGMNPAVLGRKYAALLDIDVDEAVVEGMPSIVAMNAAASKPSPQPGTGDPASDPGAQGPAGAQNAPAPGQPAPGPQAAFPAPAGMVLQ